MSETYKSNRNVFYSCRYKVVLCPRISAKSVRAGGRNALIRDHQAGLPGALGRDRRIGSHTRSCSTARSMSIRNLASSTGQVDPRTFLTAFKSGISGAQAQIADLWTNSYFCATTGGAPLSVITYYIEQQKHV